MNVLHVLSWLGIKCIFLDFLLRSSYVSNIRVKVGAIKSQTHFALFLLGFISVCEDNSLSFFSSIFSSSQALEACKDAGLVKSLGVSNFNRRQLELLLNKPGLKHKPVSNQVSLIYLTETTATQGC